MWLLSVVFFGIGFGLLHIAQVARVANINRITSVPTAHLTLGLLHLFGNERARLSDETVIQTPRFSVRVIFECTAAINILLLVAILLAFPAAWRAKLVGILIGIVLLVILNQVRILILIGLGPYLSPEAFDGVHMVLLQSLMLLFTLAYVYVWGRRYGRLRPAEEVEPARLP